VQDLHLPQAHFSQAHLLQAQQAVLADEVNEQDTQAKLAHRRVRRSVFIRINRKKNHVSRKPFSGRHHSNDIPLRWRQRRRIMSLNRLILMSLIQQTFMKNPYLEDFVFLANDSWPHHRWKRQTARLFPITRTFMDGLVFVIKTTTCLSIDGELRSHHPRSRHTQ
jgi:hypothetical protein